MQEMAQEFFARYAQALLDRDSETIAKLYATPALVAFPGNSIAVTDPAQTKDFFDRGWAGYEGVSEAVPTVAILAETDHSVWADVTWSYDGEPKERFIYQLLKGADGWQVGVLTPLEL